MAIENNKVVSIHYTLRNDAGATLDSSVEKEPLAYIQGIGNIIPGLEEALMGKKVGDKLDVSIPPEKAYGPVQEELVQQVPKEQFGDSELEPNMQFQANTEQGPIIVTIKEVGGETVTVDGNHPLAGETLHFSVEVMDIREASAEELDHGHAHGPGGHNH